MEKVFLVWRHINWEPSYLVGVYSDLNLAKAAAHVEFSTVAPYSETWIEVEGRQLNVKEEDGATTEELKLCHGLG